MKYYKILILLIFCFSNALSQSISIMDIDTTNFPVIKAKFFAFDDKGELLRPSKSDFSIIENGIQRQVINVTCPSSKPLKKVSVAMSIDISGSMTGSESGEIPVEMGKLTATELCKLVISPPSEFALQICNDKAQILQDFTVDKNKILTKLQPITATGENDFAEELLNNLTGLLNIAKFGKNNRVAVIYTDAWWYALTPLQLNQCIDTCKKYNIQFYAIIYSRPEAEIDGITASLKAIAKETGGVFFDGVTSLKAAKDIAWIIQKEIQESDACTIEWNSEVRCKSDPIDLEIKLLPMNISSKTSYTPPYSSIARLEIKPTPLRFYKTLKDTCTTVEFTAINSDINITDIKLSNPAYRIYPSANVLLKKGKSIPLTICYTPPDSGYTFCKVVCENDLCPASFYASGGFPGIKPKIRTLKLIQPNGGEVFIAGSDTIITYEGVPPEDFVTIEYRTDDLSPWIKLTDSAQDFSYKFHVPRIASDKYLARVSAKATEIKSECSNGDVVICNQIWMGCNLNVDTYRNGDSILEVRDSVLWGQIQIGAWCYYNNDPAMGEIYGKLYNWYAVNDPRGLAPEGWHIPSNEEWTELEMCLGDSNVTGGLLKEKGTDHWHFPNLTIEDKLNFLALPGGWHLCTGDFGFLGEIGSWWTATETDKVSAWFRKMTNNGYYVGRGNFLKNYGFSVRCLRN